MKKIRFAKIKGFLKGKSFAGAMCLSVAAVGIAAYIAYDSALNAITGQETEENSNTSVFGDINDSASDNAIQDVNNTVSGIPKPSDDNTGENNQPESSDSENNSDTEANNFLLDTEKRIMPLEGDIINPYSNGELVKSETLGVWKTHDGIDIAAPFGSEVKAAASGTVIGLNDDPLWGVCVIIDHGDGTETHYYGLDKALTVKEKSAVEQGQIIGKTAAFDCEAKLPPHLHYAVKKNGEWIDPLS